MTAPASATLDAGLPVPAFFTTRAGGVSSGPYESFNLGRHVDDEPEAVDANRARLEALAGATIAYMSQVHGDRVVVVGVGDPAPEADGLVTQNPHLALAVLVADCVPILLHDIGSGAVAAVHAGRAGVVRGVVPSAIRLLSSLAGGGAATISASLGPAICGGCYEVPEAMREAVSAVVPAARSTTTWGTPSLDLRAAVWAQLEESGVKAIRLVGGCTREDPALFSHRRDGATGRFAGLIGCGSS